MFSWKFMRKNAFGYFSLALFISHSHATPKTFLSELQRKNFHKLRSRKKEKVFRFPVDTEFFLSLQVATLTRTL